VIRTSVPPAAGRLRRRFPTEELHAMTSTVSPQPSPDSQLPRRNYRWAVVLAVATIVIAVATVGLLVKPNAENQVGPAEGNVVNGGPAGRDGFTAGRDVNVNPSPTTTVAPPTTSAQDAASTECNNGNLISVGGAVSGSIDFHCDPTSGARR
jgi:hypothetical protein